MILDEIVENKRVEVARAKTQTPLAALEARIAAREKPRDFAGALAAHGISLIAEIKRASPSRGDMLPGVIAPELARVYEANGARAISVLTDQKYFKGSLDDLTSVHAAVNLPCLRKEFIVDPYQIYEARAADADAVLLIVRILTDTELLAYRQLAESLGMAVLVEAHTADEVHRALDAGAHIVGINNRDLDTLEISLDTTLRLRELVPAGHILVSESGIYTRGQVETLEHCGVDAILVGESLLTNNDAGWKIQELLGAHAG